MAGAIWLNGHPLGQTLSVAAEAPPAPASASAATSGVVSANASPNRRGFRRRLSTSLPFIDVLCSAVGRRSFRLYRPLAMKWERISASLAQLAEAAPRQRLFLHVS